MKKRLNTDAISNELKGSSLFFRRPDTDDAPSTASAQTDASPRSVLPTMPNQPPRPAPPPRGFSPTFRDHPERSVRPGRRLMRRHAFEIYDDQLEGLRRQAMLDRMAGGDGSMSRMVREAIDQLLTREEGRED